MAQPERNMAEGTQDSGPEDLSPGGGNPQGPETPSPVTPDTGSSVGRLRRFFRGRVLSQGASVGQPAVSPGGQGQPENQGFANAAGTVEQSSGATQLDQAATQPELTPVAPTGSETAPPQPAEAAPVGVGLPPKQPPPSNGEGIGINEEPEPSERRKRLERVDIWGPDFKEIGISIARDIIDLEAEVYQVKYNDEGRRLGGFYEEWKAWVARRGEQSFRSKEYKESDYPPDIDEELVKQETQTEDSLDDVTLTCKQVFDQYEKSQFDSSEALKQAEAYLSRFFKEAKRMGLLNGVDDSLKSIDEEIRANPGHNFSRDQIMVRAEQRQQAVSVLGKRTFEALRRSASAKMDPKEAAKLSKLDGVWDAYSGLAIGRFALLLNGGGLIRPPDIEGEFKVIDVSGEGIDAFRKLIQEREVYWHPTYANYFEVNARTPEQFQVAVDTFTRWLRSGLTKSPQEIFQRVSGFKDALTTAGVREKIDTDFMVGLRRELEGLVGVLGASFANEHYNADYYKQFLTFLAQDEGPDRFIRLSRANRGKLAAVLWKLDNDPKFELYFSSHGSRGQLAKARNPIEQEELQEQIKVMLIREIMGTEIKGYHPGDSQRRLRKKAYEDNLKAIARFQSDESFQNLFEGFSQGDQDIFYKELEEKLGKLARAKEIQKQIDAGKNLDTLGLADQDKVIYHDFKNGLLTPTAYEQRLDQAKRIQQALVAGKDLDELSGEDKVMYEEAKSAVDLAFEFYGIMGEKAKRGGGAVFLVDKEIKDYKGEPVVDYVPIHWAEKFVQFAENWTKATYGDRSAEEVKNRVGQARRMAIWALKKYGFEAKLFDFAYYRDGKVADPNTLGYSKYGLDDSKKSIAEQYRYAVPMNPRVLGYDANGYPVFLIFDENEKLKDFPLDGVIYDRSKGDRRPIKLKDALDKDLGVNTKAEQVMLKTPMLQAEGTFGPFSPGEKPVDFQTAVNHIYSRWTGHAYWGYQEEDTGLFLADETFTDARAIKEGRLRPEDARPHAVQLLIVDPTLERVAHFPHRENREDRIALAAVEDSYQGHWRITDELYQAFYSDDADDAKNRIAYGLQDFGGSTKEWFHARAEAARWTDMKVRRLRTMIPVLPLHFTSMSEMWGAGKALDVLRMMNYGEYRMIGQFALEKWINQTEAAQDVYEALFGFVDSQGKRSREGLGEKPNNDADKLQLWFDKLDSLLGESTHEEVDNQFLNAVRESLGRLDILFQRIRVLETDKRGERTPLWLEGVDIFKRNPDGSKSFNTDIDGMSDTGSARHSGDLFFWRFVRWLRSSEKREGGGLYPDTAFYYQLMDQSMIAYKRVAKEAEKAGKSLVVQSRWDWLLGKINR